MFKFLFKNLCFFQKRKRLAPGVQAFLVLLSMPSQAFLSEILEAKKKLEGSLISLENFTEDLEELGGFNSVEKEYRLYEKELKELQESLEEYERLGLDVKDFLEFKNHNPDTIKEQINFFKNYVKKAKDLLKTFSSLTKSPETITASEQIETNKTLRALLEDSQTKELRRLRAEIAKEKLLLERRKKEQEFINKQYAYINRHSKKKGFGVFHPFQNKQNQENKKRKKFLGIF